MSIDIEKLREKFEEVRRAFGTKTARDIIRTIGESYSLRDVPEHLYEKLFNHAEEALHAIEELSRHPEAEGLRRAGSSLNAALSRVRGVFMAGFDDLKTAVDGAVSEMGKAADYIRNHPAAQNDQALADMATRLKAAADALSGVDVVSAVDSSGTVSATGTVSNGGTVGSTDA